MFGTGEMFALLAIMLVMVFAGVHVAVALGAGAVVGIYMMHGDITVVRTFIASTAYEALRYVFAFIRCHAAGEFLAKCGAARSVQAINRLMRVVPGRSRACHRAGELGVRFRDGVAIAAAAAFRASVPEMIATVRAQIALGSRGQPCLGC